MALPTTAECKAYLRVEHTAEDALLDGLLASATAAVEAHVGRPLAAVARTFVDPAETQLLHRSVTQLLIPVTPVSTADGEAPVVTDADGTVVDASTYRLDAETGQLIAHRGVSFDNGPYTIATKVGLSARSDYATRVEPVLRSAILDTVADLYQRRNPSAQAEGAGGGVYTQFAAGAGLPARVIAMLTPFTAVRA